MLEQLFDGNLMFKTDILCKMRRRIEAGYIKIPKQCLNGNFEFSKMRKVVEAEYMKNISANFLWQFRVERRHLCQIRTMAEAL